MYLSSPSTQVILNVNQNKIRIHAISFEIHKQFFYSFLSSKFRGEFLFHAQRPKKNKIKGVFVLFLWHSQIIRDIAECMYMNGRFHKQPELI